MAGSGDTRRRALDAALELFAQKGYDGACVGDVAQALGIKTPSLYKYFRGKDDLYAAVLEEANAYFQDFWAGTEARLERLEHVAVQAGVLTPERLEEDGGDWFFGQLEDVSASCYRRLSAGQACLWERPVALFEGLFARLIDQDILRRGDPHVMAVEFVAPLVQLWQLRDYRPDQVKVCQEEARQHLRQFHRVFAHREQRNQGSSGPVGRLFRR